MNFWHMQLHEGDFRNTSVDDIRKILSYNLIGCSGEPVGSFNQIEIGDIILIRHGGTVVALVETTSQPRDVLPEEKDDNIWFNRCMQVKVLQEYNNLKISGDGWFLPKTLMPVDNAVAYNFIYNLYKQIQMQKYVELLRYKKQIILQGPPGTGKTRMAKEIAKELTLPKSIKEEDIKIMIKVGCIVYSISDRIPYTVSSIQENGISLRLENGTIQTRNFNHIIEAWKNLIESKPLTGGDAYQAAIAKYVIDNWIDESKLKIIQFHPSYSYEDFVRGITADTNAIGQVEYKVENKTLAEFAQRALDNKGINYVLVIDEINRANLPSVLGELIYALEYRYDPDKPKENVVESMYSLKQEGGSEEGDKKLRLPTNLYIIGTMNTADRSVGHIDYAIRRRFAFVDVPPSSDAINDYVPDPLRSKAIELFNKVSNLFAEGIIAPDFKANDVQLGHSYFLAKTEDELKLKLDYEIKPLLKEYLTDGILLADAPIKGITQKTWVYIDQLSF